MQAACRTVVVGTPTVELTTCPFASVARYSGETTPARVQRDRPTPRWPAPLRSRSLSPWCSRVSLGDASLGPALRPRAELWQRPVSESGRLCRGTGPRRGHPPRERHRSRRGPLLLALRVLCALLSYSARNCLYSAPSAAFVAEPNSRAIPPNIGWNASSFSTTTVSNFPSRFLRVIFLSRTPFVTSM